MGEDFKGVVRSSFANVKDHIKRLEQEMQQNRDLLNKLSDELNKFRNMANNNHYSKSSTGNEGVQSINHSINQSINHINSAEGDIKSFFQTLTKREFLVFLAIFQLERERRADYNTIATKLSLTNGCIRGYVSNLIKKGAPITKIKLNNKKTILAVDAHFRTLTSEQRLIEIYYQMDTSQTQLHPINSHF